jgi:hypothetical protein
MTSYSTTSELTKGSPTSLLERLTTDHSSVAPVQNGSVYPSTRVQGQPRQAFGNPTPVALIGFLIAGLPVSAALLGSTEPGDSVGHVVAGNTVYIFFGGVLVLAGAIGHWIMVGSG